ncbi:YhgE/Pip domain-containing protein [Paenibacillus sinopodophylli]|uniref:YhgE/Pip domain-containing protein n=1 Tax=Paenibacillus sinopodophylli TaxID=1837342 RepID=UPI00110D18FA|nr:ABC transporter permease [Paenibacillus sinopodophylli]
MNVFKSFMKAPTTVIGMVFGLIVPLLFVMIWMTGYDGASERLDKLDVAIVATEGTQGAGIADQIENEAPFHAERMANLEDAQARMNEGEIHMIIVIADQLADDVQNKGNGAITYYVNEANSELAKGMMQSVAAQITSNVSGSLAGMNELPVHQELVKTNSVSNFSTTMLPMILGFISYIAVMTMNIQLNLSSLKLQSAFSKWEIFFARQKLLLLLTIVFPFIITAAAMLFVDVSSSFITMWTFHMVVYLACICVTQMAFALFGQAGPLFNVGLVPLQLLTAGNIIPAVMLTAPYRNIGQFLPAPNAIQGYMKLIYGSGGSISSYIINLLLISCISWGVTVVCVARRKKTAPAAQASVAAHH